MVQLCCHVVEGMEQGCIFPKNTKILPPPPLFSKWYFSPKYSEDFSLSPHFSASSPWNSCFFLINEMQNEKYTPLGHLGYYLCRVGCFQSLNSSGYYFHWHLCLTACDIGDVPRYSTKGGLGLWDVDLIKYIKWIISIFKIWPVIWDFREIIICWFLNINRYMLNIFTASVRRSKMAKAEMSTKSGNLYCKVYCRRQGISWLGQPGHKTTGSLFAK